MMYVSENGCLMKMLQLAKHNELLELWSDSNTYANKQRYGKVKCF